MQTHVRSFSPLHLNDFLECEHLAALGLSVARGKLVRPEVVDPQAELIRRKGEEHERAYLAQLRAEGKSVLVVDTDDRDWERAARVTAEPGGLARGRLPGRVRRSRGLARGRGLRRAAGGRRLLEPGVTVASAI